MFAVRHENYAVALELISLQARMLIQFNDLDQNNIQDIMNEILPDFSAQDASNLINTMLPNLSNQDLNDIFNQYMQGFSEEK